MTETPIVVPPPTPFPATIPLPPPPIPTVTDARWADAAHTVIVAVVDGETVYVSDDMANRVRQIIAASGVPIAAYVPPPPTRDDYTAAITAHLDATARARNYDSALSLASYAASTNAAWAAEAAIFVAWRDAVWAYALTELAEAAAGQREVPTVAGFIAELPAIDWAEV